MATGRNANNASTDQTASSRKRWKPTEEGASLGVSAGFGEGWISRRIGYARSIPRSNHAAATAVKPSEPEPSRTNAMLQPDLLSDESRQPSPGDAASSIQSQTTILGRLSEDFLRAAETFQRIGRSLAELSQTNAEASLLLSNASLVPSIQSILAESAERKGARSEHAKTVEIESEEEDPPVTPLVATASSALDAYATVSPSAVAFPSMPCSSSNSQTTGHYLLEPRPSSLHDPTLALAPHPADLQHSQASTATSHPYFPFHSQYAVPTATPHSYSNDYNSLIASFDVGSYLTGLLPSQHSLPSASLVQDGESGGQHDGDGPTDDLPPLPFLGGLSAQNLASANTSQTNTTSVTPVIPAERNGGDNAASPTSSFGSPQSFPVTTANAPPYAKYRREYKVRFTDNTPASMLPLDSSRSRSAAGTSTAYNSEEENQENQGDLNGENRQAEEGTEATARATKSRTSVFQQQLEQAMKSLKKPRLPYRIYEAEQREEILRRFPQLQFFEVTARLGKQWHGMSAEQKKPYLDIAAEEQAQYEQEFTKLKEDIRQKTEGWSSIRQSPRY